MITKRDAAGKAVLTASMAEAVEMLAQLEEAATETGLRSLEEALVILRFEKSAQTADIWGRWKHRTVYLQKKAKQQERMRRKRETLIKAGILRDLREWLELSQEAVAEECGTSIMYISYVETGKKSLEVVEYLLRRLCKIAGWSWPLFQKLVLDEC